jgi:hypothetical protein
LFVFGGSDTTGAASSTIQRSIVGDDDSLGPFAAALVALPAARSETAIAYANGSVYVTGGTDGSTAKTDVYQIGVSFDGTLGAVTPVSSLGTARRGHAAIISQGQLCVLGGLATTNAPMVSVECATISPTDGSLGAFAGVMDTTPVAVSLSTARAYTSVAVVGSNIELVGGLGTTMDLASVDQAGLGPATANPISPTFAANGTVTVPSMSTRAQAASIFVGDFLYLIGGDHMGGLSSKNLRVDASSFNTVFALDNTSILATPRRAASAVVVGNRAYVLGGQSDMPAAGNTTTSIETSTLQ